MESNELPTPPLPNSPEGIITRRGIFGSIIKKAGEFINVVKGTNIEEESLKQGRLSRRTFLKIAAVTGAAGVTAINGAKFLEALEPLEEAAFVAGLPDEVPPALQSVEIPKRNEHYRPTQEIVQEALDIYNGWHEQNPQLPGLHWKKPDNYLAYKRLADNIVQETTSSKLSSGPLDYKSNLYFAVDNNNRPYSQFIRFGGNPISSYSELIEYDPGSGLVKKAVDKFRELKNDQNYDLYSEIKNRSLSDQDSTILTEEIRKDIEDALDYIRKQGQGKPVSTSLLLAYFLHQNGGDIAQSFWDTTVVLKLLCRNNLADLKYQPTREAADLSSSLFLDEFSPEVSLNWLCDNIPPSEGNLDNPREKKFKNYQPINRAGGLYHAWNIISWSTCMPPTLAQNLVRSYFGLTVDYRSEHGKEKIRSDIRVAASSRGISKLIGPYEQTS